MSKVSDVRRPVLSLILAALVGVLVATPVVVYASHRFDDVPDSHTFHNAIDWLADNGITVGCNPPVNDRYCPQDNVTRGQMAAFMKRLAEGQVVDAATVDGLSAEELGGQQGPQGPPGPQGPQGPPGAPGSVGAAPEFDSGGLVAVIPDSPPGIEVLVVPDGVGISQFTFVALGGGPSSCSSQVSKAGQPIFGFGMPFDIPHTVGFETALVSDGDVSVNFFGGSNCGTVSVFWNGPSSASEVSALRYGVVDHPGGLTWTEADIPAGVALTQIWFSPGYSSGCHARITRSGTPILEVVASETQLVLGPGGVRSAGDVKIGLAGVGSPTACDIPATLNWIGHTFP